MLGYAVYSRVYEKFYCPGCGGKLWPEPSCPELDPMTGKPLLYCHNFAHPKDLPRTWRCSRVDLVAFDRLHGISPAMMGTINESQQKETGMSSKPATVEVNTEQILEERGSRYGSFSDNSRISQEIKALLRRENEERNRRGQPPLQDHHLEALDMIAAKICRIFSGDPNYADNWDDIAGYAQLGKNPR